MEEKVFSGGDSIILQQTNHERIRAAKSALEDNLGAEYRGVLFEDNTAWSIAGAAGWIVLALAVLLATFVCRGQQVAPSVGRGRHATIGAWSTWDPVDPKNRAPPNEKIPPSAATSQ